MAIIMVYVIFTVMMRNVFGESNVIFSKFKLTSCTESEFSANISQGVKVVPNRIHCAVFIRNSLRVRGIFRPNSNECQLVPQHTTENSENITDISRDVCTALSKYSYHQVEERAIFAQWEELYPKGLEQLSYAEFLPVKIVFDKTERKRFVPARYSVINSIPCFVETHDYLHMPVGEAAFSLPFSYSVVMYRKGNKIKRTKINVFGDGKKEVTKDTKEFKTFVRNDFKGQGPNSGFLIVDSLDSMITALLNGYRRVQRGPHNTRALIEVQHDDVHFDTTEMILFDNTLDQEDSLYVTSVKESVKSGKGYVFRHQFNVGSNSLPCDETDIDSFWVMETSWEKMQLKSTETMVDVLREIMLEGKELRMVMGGEISTDIVSAVITKNDVIVTLTKYLIPFKGIDSKDSKTQFVRFPVYGLNEDTLIECETEFMTSTLTNVYNTKYTSNIDWFVSSRNWTKVLEIEPDYKIVSGSFQQLYEGGGQGNNVRVCVSENSGNILCHGLSKVSVYENKAIVQSVSMLQVVLDDSKKLQDVHGHCERSYRVIEAGGPIKSVNVVSGINETITVDIFYQKQEWFVEY